MAETKANGASRTIKVAGQVNKISIATAPGNMAAEVRTKFIDVATPSRNKTSEYQTA